MKDETIQSRSPSDGEWATVIRCIYDAFGVASAPQERELEAQLRPANRRVLVADSQGIFGGAFAYDFALSLPGGTVCPVGGLAGVGITPVSQGRGGLQAMMRTHLEQSMALGDAASVLMASESGIYHRYGYGVVTEMVRWHLDTRAFALAHRETDESMHHASERRIKLLHDRQQAIVMLASIHRQYCHSRAMEIVRDELWWRYMLEPEDASWVSVGKTKFIAVHFNSRGEADGYAIYSVEDDSESSFSHGRSNSRVVLTELCTLSLEGELSLFRYLVNLPWCRELFWELGPVDPPVRHFMSDPRQLWQQSRVDMLWLRPLDVQRLLTQRQYTSDGTVVINYVDHQLPELSGCWQLMVEAGRARLQKSVSDRYVSLGPAEFATVYAGAARVAELSAVGKITGDSESINALDRLFLTPRAPFNSTRF